MSKTFLSGLVGITLFVFAAVSTVTAQTPPVSVPAPAAASTAPRMSNALVQALLGLAKKRYSHTLLGVNKSVGDSFALSVMSNRSLIAWRNAAAVEEGGRFTPPADMRVDIVRVNCGDSDLGDIFECSRVRVTGPKGQRVTPITYHAGPQSYRNALGNRWTVREVSATYHVRDLREGFTVTFAGTDGTEWDLVVSADDADFELLLKMNTDS